MPTGGVLFTAVVALFGVGLNYVVPEQTFGTLLEPIVSLAVALILFAGLLVGPTLVGPALLAPSGAAGPAGQGLALFDAFYRAGALVFGGGHVVLPLLQAEVVGPGWIDPARFLAGYGAAQAVPGPLFTVAAYLGAAVGPVPHGLPGAVIALVAIFLPGLLLVYGALPYWDGLRARPRAQAAMRGTNAAVVGILGAALYDPVWVSAVGDARDFALAVLAFVLLTAGRAPPWIVVLLTAAGGLEVGEHRGPRHRALEDVGIGRTGDLAVHDRTPPL